MKKTITTKKYDGYGNLLSETITTIEDDNSYEYSYPVQPTTAPYKPFVPYYQTSPSCENYSEQN